MLLNAIIYIYIHQVSGRRLVIDNALQLSSIERTRVDPVFSAGKLDAWSSIGSGAGGSSGSSDRGHGMRGGVSFFLSFVKGISNN